MILGYALLCIIKQSAHKAYYDHSYPMANHQRYHLACFTSARLETHIFLMLISNFMKIGHQCFTEQHAYNSLSLLPV